jgi:hypothetical protein
MGKEIPKAYHYTSWQNINPILGGKFTRHGKKGKGLIRHRGYLNQIGRGEKASYALMEPSPESWRLNPNGWEKLMSYVGPVLLEIDLPKFVKKRRAIGSIFVGDWNAAVERGDIAYENSFISIGEYIQQENQMNLPELQNKRRHPFRIYQST